MTNENGSERCRFDLFVRISHDKPSIFPNNQRCFTYRGDKYSNEEQKMLTYLMNIIRKYYQSYSRMILYDNDLQVGDPNREAFSMRGRDIQQNILKRQYPFAFEKMKWPEWIIREKILTANDRIEDIPR